jgi:hypothetical protein
MADHMDNGLIASIKALDDVVAASIDARNPLVREQLALVSRYLGFVRQRLPLQFDRDRFELEHYTEVGKAVAQIAGLPVVSGAPSLNWAIQIAETALANARLTSAQLRSATELITTALSVLVRCVASATPDVRRQVERTVTVSSARLFDLQRAWYLPMGFEPDPGAVPTLSQALQAKAA